MGLRDQALGQAIFIQCPLVLPENESHSKVIRYCVGKWGVSVGNSAASAVQFKILRGGEHAGPSPTD